MPAEAPAAPTQAPAPANVIESAPKTSVDTFPELSGELDEIIGKSGLGTKENEDRVSNRGRKSGRQEKPAEKPAEKQPEKAIAPEKKEEAKPETKDDEVKEGEIKPEESKPEEGKTEKDKPLGPWQRVHAAERKVKELESKLEEFAKRKPTDDPEKLEFKKRYEETEQRYKALDEEMRYIDYQRSSEFKEKYQKPYEDLAKRGVASLMDYRVAQEDGTQRPATAKDFWDVVSLPSQPDARQKAKQLFGEDAQDILDWRTKLRDSYFTMEQAKQDFKARGEERQKETERQQQEQQAAQQQQQEADMALWKQLNDTAIEKHKDWFTAADDDKEGADLLKQGFELADLAWNGSDKLDREKLIALRSAERNKAAGFRYMVHKYEKANARVAELEKELEQYRNSEPGKGEVKGDERKSDGYDIDAEIARIPTVN